VALRWRRAIDFSINLKLAFQVAQIDKQVFGRLIAFFPVLGEGLRHDPIQLGRYINFLHQQVEAYLREDPLKALKRGLSLSRVMFLDDHGETIIELLRDEQGALAGAIAARAALLEELEGTECGDPVRRGVLDRLRSELEIMISRLRSHDRAGPHRPDWRGDVERFPRRRVTMSSGDKPR
jgi:hypothetical protein